MTAKKPDPLNRVPFFIPRHHYACRIRVDLHAAMKEKCRELNCSQGVFLEVAISKILLGDIVTEKDVFEYSANDRWLHRVVSDLIATGTTEGKPLDAGKRGRMVAYLSRVLFGGEEP